ncbi:MAG TPA: AAA family ATPase [Chloroflexi bacterium]|nr:AAA family ATPase [Chloroflexota bacterium]
MKDKIEDILKKTAGDISKTNSQSSSKIENNPYPGDPNCEICGGVGYIRQDLPLGHPDFGKMQICVCRTGQLKKLARDGLYKMSNLESLSHLTFDNFESRGQIGLGPAQAASLERAFNHARQFARTLDGWLVLQGPYGCGKTHLAAAVANFVVDIGVPTLFLTVPDLLDSLRFSYNDPASTFEERFEEIRCSQLLVMDDFGTENATSWAQEKLFQILNYRYINNLPLLITTNLSLNQLEGRISSRLQDPELVTRVKILAPDYRRPMDDTGHSELSSLGLLSERTFGNFSLRKDENLEKEEAKKLESAFKAAQQYAEKPRGWLVFQGGYASGKTHLAAAIANYRSAEGIPPLFIMVPDLMDHLRATFSPDSKTSYDRRFDEIKTTPLLVLDDLGTESMTPWVKEKLYQLFNYRYNAGLPTVITTTDKLSEVDPRIRSRMLDRRICRIYAITAPPYRGGR